MTFPQEKIPWACLTDHVDFDGSTGFKIRLGSQIDIRKKAFAHFTRVLASIIVEVAEDQLSHIPKPNAPRDAWSDVGVQDDALFPADFVDPISVPAHINTDDIKFLERQYWEHIIGDDYDIQFILTVLTQPENPFRHLAPLMYLAQHPRVPMENVCMYSSTGYWEYETGSGLRSFAFFTMSYYLLLNLVLALDSGASFDTGTTRASLFHSRFQNSRSLVPFSNDPHTAFWYSVPPAYQSPDLRASYSLHCFRLLVALYAFMKEVTLRDIAVGVKPYKLYRGGDTSAFDKSTLVDVICRALTSISAAFSDLERSLVDDPPAILPHDPPASNISHQPQGEPRQQSLFVGLPTEIHQYIYSFLPVGLQSLVNLAATCKRLQEIYTPLIYVDPFSPLASTMETIHNLEAQSSALTMALSSKPELASHIRRLRVRVEGSNSSDDLRMLKYPPLQLCLADSITHLVELQLYAPYVCQDCKAKLEDNDSFEVACHFRTMDAIAAVTRRWPNLSSLSLIDLGASLDHLDGAPAILSPMPGTSIPRNLEKLSIIPYGFAPVSWATQKALMNASSQTLRHLVFRYERITTHDLPAFPRLEGLELTTDLPMEDIRLLVQKSFSSVHFLSLHSTHNSEEASDLTLDLSGIFNGLEHLAVATWSMLPLSRLILPPSVATVQMYYYNIDRPSMISIAGWPHLAALSFEVNNYTSIGPVYDLFLDLSEHASTFQTLRSLELKKDIEVHQLPRLGEIIAARLPKLEVLILSVGTFSNRPRREDYPTDDGLDDLQKAAAVSLFKSCPGLITVSFNGIPDIWDPIGRFPARVWTRDSGDGAHMTGRAALPWKLGEIWGLYLV